MSNSALMLSALRAIDESAVILGDNEVVSKDAMELVRAAIAAEAPERASAGASLYLGAVTSLWAFEDWTHQNEAQWSGWGDMIVPPGATFWRVKAGQAVAALSECCDITPITARDVDTCPICAKPLNDDDICATDIEMGICHAACLEGSPTVNLETGEPVDGPMDTFRYGDDEENCVVCGEHLETGDLVYWSTNDDGHMHPECTTRFVDDDGRDTDTPPQPFEFRSERHAVARKSKGHAHE